MTTTARALADAAATEHAAVLAATSTAGLIDALTRADIALSTCDPVTAAAISRSRARVLAELERRSS